MQTVAVDVLIVGGGSGGFGAALRVARHAPNARVVVVESMPMLGGTSTLGGVNNWEPGVGGLGVHYDLYARMAQIPEAIGVGRTVHAYSPDEPYGLSRIAPDSPYESSLRRAGLSGEQVRRVHFEPDLMARVMHEMLTEQGVEVRCRTRITGVTVDDRRIVSVTRNSYHAVLRVLPSGRQLRRSYPWSARFSVTNSRYSFRRTRL